jgi:hypothetical protein
VYFDRKNTAKNMLILDEKKGEKMSEILCDF